MYLNDRSLDRVGGDVTVSAARGLPLATLGGDRKNADSVDLLDGSLDLSLGGSSIDFERESVGLTGVESRLLGDDWLANDRMAVHQAASLSSLLASASAPKAAKICFEFNCFFIICNSFF